MEGGAGWAKNDHMRFLPAMLCVLVMVVARAAMAARPEPVRVSLLSDHSAVGAGEVFRVGVKFTIEPGWHIYWKNPGDSGLATKVKWDLPAGFTASAMQWPTPRLFKLPGDISNIGYENEVMLITEIRTPAAWHGPALIVGQVQWLACKEVCVPGGQTVRVSVDVGGSAVATDSETFVACQGRMPRVVGAATPVEGVTVEHVGQTYLLRVHEDAPISDPVVFVSAPAPAGAGVKAQVREQKANDMTVEITAAAKTGPVALGEAAEVVVCWTGASGAARSVVLPVPPATER